MVLLWRHKFIKAESVALTIKNSVERYEGSSEESITSFESKSTHMADSQAHVNKSRHWPLQHLDSTPSPLFLPDHM